MQKYKTEIRTLQFFIIAQIIFIYSYLGTINPAHGIIFVAPVVMGLVQIILWVIGLASLPATIISAFVNLDKLKKSKWKFFLFTLITWIVILSILAGVTALVIHFFHIEITI